MGYKVQGGLSWAGPGRILKDSGKQRHRRTEVLLPRKQVRSRHKSTLAGGEAVAGRLDCQPKRAKQGPSRAVPQAEA